MSIVRERASSFGRDNNGNRTGVRTYRVSADIAPSALVSNPTIYGVPNVGDVWEGMVADSITITTSPDPTTVYDASVNYSTNGSYEFEQQADESADVFAGGTYTETIQLPHFRRISHTIPGLPPVTIQSWVPREFNISERRERVVRSVSVPSAQLNAAVEAVRAQTQKRHTINGRQYLFTGATYSVRSTDVYQFEYSWEWDGGTPFDFDAAGDPNIAMPGPFTADGQQWNPTLGAAYFRPPYAFIVPGEISSLEFIAIVKVPLVPLGYQSLINVGIP